MREGSQSDSLPVAAARIRSIQNGKSQDVSGTILPLFFHHRSAQSKDDDRHPTLRLATEVRITTSGHRAHHPTAICSADTFGRCEKVRSVHVLPPEPMKSRIGDPR